MSSDPVSERRKELLRIVVQEYVDSAQPVASQSIADKYNLGVSSATIRNDMAALERDGLLTHPHTSAGRVPTDAGYRYFVRHLVPDMELPSSERRMIRHQFHQSRREIDQWLRLSTAVLSQASNAAALATTPRLAAKTTSASRISTATAAPISPSDWRRRRIARACNCETRDSLTPISAPISFIVTSP